MATTTATSTRKAAPTPPSPEEAALWYYATLCLDEKAKRNRRRSFNVNLPLALRFCEVIRELGGVAGEGDKATEYTLATKYGPLWLGVRTNCSQEGATVYARFLEQRDGAFPKLRHCNPYSGKWNHHFFVHPEGYDRAVASLREELTRVLPARVLRDPIDTACTRAMIWGSGQKTLRREHRHVQIRPVVPGW